MIAMLPTIEWSEILIRLSLAGFLGAAIGLERERKEWAAGMRTHMMVCLGSALAMIVSAYAFTEVLDPENNVSVRLDPSRVAAQVISGIGFIGAGTIMFLRQKIVRGLTTAAGLWTVAAIGLAIGGGMYFAGVVATTFAIVILWGMQLFEKKFFSKHRLTFLRITVLSKKESAIIMERILNADSLTIESFSFERDEEHTYTLQLNIRAMEKKELARMVGMIQSELEIKELKWES